MLSQCFAAHATVWIRIQCLDLYGRLIGGDNAGGFGIPQ